MTDIDYHDCSQVFARLDDWVDRELAPADMERIQRHLEICARCASEFRVEGELLRALRSKVRRIHMPPGLEARVWRNLNDANRGED